MQKREQKLHRFKFTAEHTFTISKGKTKKKPQNRWNK